MYALWWSSSQPPVLRIVRSSGACSSPARFRFLAAIFTALSSKRVGKR
jgi:hypothetical protein